MAQIGRSVLVYEGTFRVPHLAARSHAARAMQLSSRGAIAEAQREAQLAPNDPRVQRALATVRERAGARP